MMENEEETPKLTKTEEKESFLKRLEEKNNENKKLVEEMRQLVERNEELAARKLLGGISDAGIQPIPALEETPKDYVKKVMSGEIKFKD